ncbi:MAG: efflux RND transporter permease subunit [Gemmatimonadota bacterium]
MSLTSHSVRRPVTTVAATLALCLLGAVSLSRLPVSLLPDVTLPILTIRTSYSGAAASEMSRLVAEPIEQAIAATPGLVELRSVSRTGEVTTTAAFAWGTDMAVTVLQVRERLDNARSQLPREADRPTLLTSDPGQRPIAVIGATGPGDLRSLSHTVREVHARRLEQLAGVASVAVVGGPEDEIRVDVDPGRMRSLDLSPADIASALSTANASAAGGTIRRGQFRFSVRTLTEFQSIADIEQVPVGPLRSGIRIRDIATVSLSTANPKTVTRLDGHAAVGLVVYKDAGANTVSVTGDIQQAIAQLAREFPDVHLTVVAAQAQFVSDALSNLVQEIILGGILSLIVILLVLEDWRGSLAIALIIPLSVLVSLMFLQALHVTINVLSLGGLALGVGLLVDNAIVVAEAAKRKREEGLNGFDAAVIGTEEVASPLIAGTLTTLLVFGPIVFVRGLAAALFRDLSISVVASITASLVLALTLMPVMLIGRPKGEQPGRPDQLSEGWLDRVLGTRWVAIKAWWRRLATALLHWYEHTLDWCLARPGTVLLATTLFFGLTAWMAIRLPREVLPQVDEGVVVAALSLPSGTTIEETTRQVARVEAAAGTLGATSIYSRIGEATDEELLSGADPGTAATAQLIIPVPAGRNAGDMAERLRAAVPDLAQGALSLDLAGQSEFGSLIGREGRTVRVEISGLNPSTAESWADSARTRLRTVTDLADVRSAYAATQPVVEISLDRRLMAQRGITPDQVGSALSGALGGVKATDFRETDRRTPISVRLAGAANEDLASALGTPIKGIPLAQLVHVTTLRSPVEVVRADHRPVTIVEAVVQGGGTANAARQISAVLASLPTPAGLSWRVAGANTEQERTTGELLVVGVLSVVLVYLVLAGEFASFTVPMLVMLAVPLAACGGIVVLWMTGQSLNAVSLIGIVVMLGLADNEAVVKLEAIRDFRNRGHSPEESVHLGSKARLRAILMTSLTTMVGVLPMMFNLGSGGQLYQPLAAGVLGGSITALIATFYVMPTAYVVLEKWETKRALRQAVRSGRDG